MSIVFDLKKPNFIFSSDIQAKVSILSRRFLRHSSRPSLTEDGDSAANNVSVDISHGITFIINVELNTLLQRNRNLRPSDLVKENLISIAHTERNSTIRCGSRPPSIQTKNQPLTTNTTINTINLALVSSNSSVYHSYGISLAISVGDEIFIVSLHLSLLEFYAKTIDEEMEVNCDFVKDESYGILVLCDFGFIDQIEMYIKSKFVESLQSRMDGKSESDHSEEEEDAELATSFIVDISIDEDRNTSIDTQSLTTTINEIELGFELEQAQAAIDFEEAHAENMTKYHQRRTISSETDRDPITRLNTWNLIEDEIQSMQSVIELGPSAGTTPNSHETSVEPSSMTVYTSLSETEPEPDMEHSIATLLNSKALGKGVETESDPDKHILLKKPVLTKDDDDDFLSELSNLRHNDVETSKVLHSPIEERIELKSVPILEPEEMENNSDFDSDTEGIEIDINAFDSPVRKKVTKINSLSALQPPIEILRKPTPPDGYFQPPLFPPSLPPPPQTKSNQNFVSPRRGREITKRTLTGTFSLINHDEDVASELEYAFRDRSPTVPSYIKQDKKFKFIKVGKVQKFVNLFDKKPEPSGTELAPVLRCQSPQVMASD